MDDFLDLLNTKYVKNVRKIKLSVKISGMERSEQLSYTITDEGEEGEPSIRDGRGILQKYLDTTLATGEKGRFSKTFLQNKQSSEKDSQNLTTIHEPCLFLQSAWGRTMRDN